MSEKTTTEEVQVYPGTSICTVNALKLCPQGEPGRAGDDSPRLFRLGVCHLKSTGWTVFEIEETSPAGGNKAASILLERKTAVDFITSVALCLGYDVTPRDTDDKEGAQ